MSLKEKIKSNEFVILGEFEPPKGADLSSMLRNADLVKGRIDAIVIPEMANAVMKVSSLGGCAFLQTHGFETVLQVCCRDRNRLALQADILAANALGVSNIMTVTGENITYGDHHQAKPVYDLDHIELLLCIRDLQNGRDMAGIELKGNPDFFTGSVINAGARGDDLDREIEELERKIKAGIQFVITNPVFDPEAFKAVLKKIDTDKVSVIATVLLLKSAGMARYIERNIQNISIPSQIIQSIRDAPDKARQCIKIAGENIESLKQAGADGVMIQTIGWEDRLGQVLDEAGL